jgi:hypothetical protein
MVLAKFCEVVSENTGSNLLLAAAVNDALSRFITNQMVYFARWYLSVSRQVPHLLLPRVMYFYLRGACQSHEVISEYIETVSVEIVNYVS